MNLLSLLEAGRDNTSELLAKHDEALGRDLEKNKRHAEGLEKEIAGFKETMESFKRIDDILKSEV